MVNSILWDYCTPKQCQEFLLSLHLLGDTNWSEKKQISCLYAVSNRIFNHYHIEYIPKKDGNLRELLIPDPFLKQIQENILHYILDQMPVSSPATAYRKGTDILCNASAHIGKKILLKLDIQNFFGTISFSMVKRTAFSTLYFPPSIGTLLTSLCCYQGYLPQGAPTSPAISNLVMRSFDEYMKDWCFQRQISYTRYCDDMTFSGDFNPKMVFYKVRNYLTAMGFTLNSKKTRIFSQHTRQTVTGITVNDKPQVNKEYRRKLRQEIYYCKKFGPESHLQRCSPYWQPSVKTYLFSLLGKIHFVLQINPNDSSFQKAKKDILELIKEKENFC